MVTTKREAVVQAVVAVIVIAPATGRDMPWGIPLGVVVCLGYHIRKNITVVAPIPTRRNNFAMLLFFFLL